MSTDANTGEARSMAIIACKLEKFSALEHLLKLKSMLNVFLQTKFENKFCSSQMVSPNGKAQVLVKNGAEQQNYCQSLSPEKKTQIVCNDADAHTK